MAKTIQKKVKFSKGQVVPELAERVDLSVLDESAQKMKNVVSTVYGGVRSRYGTKYVDVITVLNEATPVSITSDIFNETSHFTDNTHNEVSTIGTNRTLAVLDFGEGEEGAATITIKNISLVPIYEEITSSGNYTKTLKKGLYEFVLVGAGGGGAYNSSENSGSGAAGNGGGTIVLGANIDGGAYSISVGAGGTKSGGVDANTWGGTGGNTTLSLGGTTLLKAGGGTGNHVWWRDGAARNGTVSVANEINSTLDVEYTTTNSEGNYGGLGSYSSGGTSVYSSTYGKGGSVRNRNSADDGNAGYVKYALLGAETGLKICGSDDGNLWEELLEETITTAIRDIELKIQYKYRYIKIELTEDATVDLQNGLRFQYIREDISLQGETTEAKLFPFVYNNKDKYLFVFVDEKAQIFKDDILVQILETTGVKNQFLREMKVTQKDDTIVIAYEDFSPKIIKRVDGVFVFSDLDIKNIPFAVFGEEEKTTYTDKWIKPSGEEGAIKLKSVKDKDNTTEDGPDIFTADMVGQYIDGNGGKVKITEFVNTKEVGGNTVIPFYTSDAFKEWEYFHGYEPVWSEKRGYPRTCLFASQRLWFGGSKQKPSTIWGSRLGDYFNFKNSGNYDNDSIDVTLLTNNPIVNMMDNRGLHIFTSGEEITASESSLTPSGFSATINTKNGSLSSLNPEVLGDGTCLFVEKNGKSLLSYIYDFNQSSYTTGNLMLLSSVMENPISLSLQRNSVLDKGDFLFIVLEDGRMIVNCFHLKENINSLAIFETEGKIKDVCCLIDDVYLLVERRGNTCLEKIQRGINCDSLETRFVDRNIIGGLYRQNGSSVYVWSDTTLYGKFLVEGFSVKLPKIPNEKCYIGLAYDCELVGNNLAINGKTTTVKKRITSAEVVCKPEQTKQLIFNGQKKNKKDGIYTFYSCTPYGKEVNFNIRTEFEPFEVYSITLNINYEG